MYLDVRLPRTTLLYEPVCKICSSFHSFVRCCSALFSQHPHNGHTKSTKNRMQRDARHAPPLFVRCRFDPCTCINHTACMRRYSCGPCGADVCAAGLCRRVNQPKPHLPSGSSAPSRLQRQSQPLLSHTRSRKSMWFAFCVSCWVCDPLRIFICFVQILVPKIAHGMTTQTGSQHAHNEDRGVAIIDLLTTHPGTDEVCFLLLFHFRHSLYITLLLSVSRHTHTECVCVFRL